MNPLHLTLMLATCQTSEVKVCSMYKQVTEELSTTRRARRLQANAIILCRQISLELAHLLYASNCSGLSFCSDHKRQHASFVHLREVFSVLLCSESRRTAYHMMHCSALNRLVTTMARPKLAQRLSKVNQPAQWLMSQSASPYESYQR